MSLKVTFTAEAQAAVDNTVAELVADKVASRLFAKDFTLWGAEAESESEKRLGWTHSASDSQALVSSIIELRNHFYTAGVTRFVLCGMGGSSLAPEVITKSAGVELVVLDSTNPEQIADALAGDLSKTAIIVSSKSGSTVETDSQKRSFEAAFDAAGIDKRDRIVVVTDPGSPMEAAAKADGYRVFNADPNVGGRYSALTAFGLVPSGLAGVDIQALLDDARAVTELLAEDSERNPGLQLGAALARTQGSHGYRNKVGLVSAGTPIVGFGDWAEQLIAESTGKIGRGVLPVVLSPNSYEVETGPGDLLLVNLVADADSVSGVNAVSGALGAQFLLWEVATAVAGRLLGVNPFDQPDVESAKIAARGMLEHRADALPPRFVSEGVAVRAHNLHLASAETLGEALRALFAELGETGYVSIQTYLDRLTRQEAEELTQLVARATGRPTTFGWGPRFLHSTGQYHKGGPREGVYLQITQSFSSDLSVPGRDFTYGQLITSQAAGDADVLGNLGRPVLTLELEDVVAGLKAIKASIG